MIHVGLPFIFKVDLCGGLHSLILDKCLFGTVDKSRMATGGVGFGAAGGSGDDDWDRVQGRKDWRHCSRTEVKKEEYEEVETRRCRALVYDHSIPFLQVSIHLDNYLGHRICL